MNSLSSRIALATLLLVSPAVPGIAQEEAAPRQQQAETTPAPTAAQPRAAVPRSQPVARTSAPVRQERAAEQRRGTDSQGRVRSPQAGSGGNDSGRRNEPRERSAGRAPSPPPTTITRPAPRRESPPPSAPATASATAPEDGQRRAVPRGSRPRGDNVAVGRAEPRDGRYYGRRDDDRIFRSRDRVYNSYYYYYPRRWYPYGYGAFGGLGYFYYDPYTWYSYDPYWSRPHYYGGSYGSYYGGNGGYATGELRLQVVPRHAEVYVDGYFAGHVDDFDGMFQSLRLEEGPYKIEVVAPGFETLEIDVRIQPDRKTTFRGELRPLP